MTSRNIVPVLFTFVLTLPLATTAEAAMSRVVAIEDPRTIAVERAGTRERVRLAGVEITDETGALALLQWTLDSRWVMLEKTANGKHLIWRSPDALFINRELVVRGFARATLAVVAPESTLAVTYLGTYRPIGSARAPLTETEIPARGGARSTAKSRTLRPTDSRSASTSRSGRSAARPSRRSSGS